jgi:sporulation related protein
MRIVVFLLLIANLTLFAYTRLDNASRGESDRLKQQVQPDKIKLLTPPQVAALGPAKLAALADVCVEWGPFSDIERVKAIADLEPLQLGRLLTQRRVDLDSVYWVSLGPFANKSLADRRSAELRGQGIADVSTIDSGRGQFAVSLGMYRTELAARARADALARQGVGLARVEPRAQPMVQTMLVVRDPQQNVLARFRELQSQYSGSDLKVGACPTTS